MLAHNAAVLGVPFDARELFSASLGSVYMEALDLVVGEVSETRRRHAEEVERKAKAQ